MGKNWNDTLDHIITALLALIFSVGMFIIYLNDGTVPEWGSLSLGAILGFYFRGRVNGQYNNSQITRMDQMLEKQELKERVDKIEKEGHH